jgi:glycosyltransferase involved in cell wall biosynthesis
MKLLWVKADFLHPTTKGGQIRTLETLKRLHERHEVHYAGLENPAEPEGPRRAAEYASRVFAVPHQAPEKSSARFAMQALGNLVSPLPLAISRWESPELRRLIARLRRDERYDKVFCDFLAPAPNFESLEGVALFQHNVEMIIWRRHASTARGALKKRYFQSQARRMFDYEREVCRSVDRVVAVSAGDAAAMRKEFGVERVEWAPTGVDVDYFARPSREIDTVADLVFLGSMDWMPNIDGVAWFAAEILPKIRARRPETSVAIVGRSPGGAIQALGRDLPELEVTGTVADVRPYLWGSKVSIVPLRIGGGTRLKIYESMAAGTAVVSTTIGAEGLEIDPPANIRLGDTADRFAEQCLELLEDEDERERTASAGLELVRSRFSWDKVVDRFEEAAGMR